MNIVLLLPLPPQPLSQPPWLLLSPPACVHLPLKPPPLPPLPLPLPPLPQAWSPTMECGGGISWQFGPKTQSKTSLAAAVAAAASAIGSNRTWQRQMEKEGAVHSGSIAAMAQSPTMERGGDLLLGPKKQSKTSLAAAADAAAGGRMWQQQWKR